MHKCEKCGQPALVHISHGLPGDEPPGLDGIRHLCLDCAAAEERPARADRRLNLAALLIMVGTFAAVISLTADELRFGYTQDFGVKQLAGTGLGMALMASGALLGIPTLLAGGALIAGLALLADYLGFGQNPGFGWQQLVGTTLGVSAAAIGVAISRRREGEKP